MTNGIQVPRFSSAAYEVVLRTWVSAQCTLPDNVAKLVSEFRKETPLIKLLAETNSDLDACLPSTLPRKPSPHPQMMACFPPLSNGVSSGPGWPRTSDSPALPPKGWDCRHALLCVVFI